MCNTQKEFNILKDMIYDIAKNVAVLTEQGVQNRKDHKELFSRTDKIESSVKLKTDETKNKILTVEKRVDKIETKGVIYKSVFAFFVTTIGAFGCVRGWFQ